MLVVSVSKQISFSFSRTNNKLLSVSSLSTKKYWCGVLLMFLSIMVYVSSCASVATGVEIVFDSITFPNKSI